MSKKKENAFDRYRPWRHIDIVKYIFVLYMSSFYLIYMNNKYFNITATRAYTFEYGVLGLVVLGVLALMVEFSLLDYYGCEKFEKRAEKVYEMPELYAGLFLLANFIAFLIADDKAAAYSGSTGRRMGLLMILCLVVAFVVLAQKTYVNKANIFVLAAVTAFSYVISYMQHFGGDPFELIKDITEKQKQLFTATFGNINTYGSFICIVCPIFVAIMIYDDDIADDIIAGIVIVMSSMSMLVSRSDNVYLGLGMSFLVLLFLSIKDKRFDRFVLSITLLSLGLFVMAFIKNVYGGNMKHINGIAEIMTNRKITGVIFFGMVIIYSIVLFLKRVLKEKLETVNRVPAMIALAVLIVIAGIVAFSIGKNSGKTDLFTFNDKWGTYRGYIWRKLFEIHRGSSFVHKLFGYGNETIAKVMKPYYDEMVAVTGKSYDNAHNELLQYLITTGLFGMLSYMALGISSFIYIIRRYKQDIVPAAMLASGIGYAAQGLVNLNQPITTPLYFVVLGVGIGYIRYRDQGYGKFKKVEEKK